NEIVSGRERAGILRIGQIRLIEAWIKSLMNEIQVKMERGVPASEIRSLLEQIWSGTTDFFAKIRSEGVGERILRYLKEDGYNMEVVKGIEKATSEKDREFWETYVGDKDRDEA